MHRTQISLEREQYDLLMREAQRRGTSLAAVVRALIVEQLQAQPRANRKAKSRLAAITGLGEGDGQAVGRNHNEFLYGRKRA